jgi:hypothetical protein
MERLRLWKMLTLVGGVCYVGFINPIGVVRDMGEGALHREDKEIKIWLWAPLGAWYQDELADRPSVAM